MPLIGNQLASAENNSFRVLDDISNFTLVFDGSSASNVSTTNDTITLYQHPFVTGQRVTYRSGGGSPIGGLISGTAYYINKVDTNTFRLSTTYAGSLQNTNLIDITSTGTGVTHSFNVAFDGINTKFKATYNNGTKCSISRAAQLDIAVNGVVQQPYDSNPPPNGFTIEADATIVFSTAPLAGFTFWGKALTNAIASFETSDNSIDTFTGNGVLKNFTLSKTPANSQNVLVTINGVLQYPSDASSTRSYSVNANILAFDVAPSNGSVIQVRYIGFAGATSSSVTGFYGRTGNVILTSSDNIAIGTAKIGPVAGVSTTLLVEGNARITGILTIGTSSITFDGRNDRLTVGTGVTIGVSSIQVGNTFLSSTGIGLGQTTTAGRNVGVNTALGTLIYNTSTSSVQFYDGTGWFDTNRSFAQATGGIISEYQDPLGGYYRAHVFTSSGTFTVTNAGPGTVDYLVVAGGGAGGQGGGGAGGFRTGTGFSISATSYPITVGAGGNGKLLAATPSPAPGTFRDERGGNGTPSIFSTITSTGGGGGGAYGDGGAPVRTGADGGSGGGGGGLFTAQTGAAGGNGNTPATTPSQGNPGGASNPTVNATAGGGGGASAAGAAGGGSVAGAGGNGTSSSISGTSVTYAGGGGGGAVFGTGGAGGTGGGGTGGSYSVNPSPVVPVSATNGTFATGGGGGGGGGPISGAGGSGIVILRYQISALSAIAKATGGSISAYNGQTIHTFTGSGTFTNTSGSPLSVEYVVVAGGGSGGPDGGQTSGGGGAGGYRTGTGFVVSPGSPNALTVTIGAGGAATSPSPALAVAGASGSPSSFGAPITAAGGGGGNGFPAAGGSGGSGGGGGNGNTTAGSGNTPPTSPPQGNPGGAGSTRGGGGGGAGGAGQASPGPAGGFGGLGVQLPATFRDPASRVGSPGPSGTYWVAGGGGGGAAPGGGFAPGGGPGGPFSGGGAGGDGTAAAGSGIQNTGGGGGGNFSGQPAGSGGSGIVIIAYPS